jgi:TonB family protein
MESTLLVNLVAYSAQVTLVVAVGAALAALVRVDAAGVRYVYWRALLAICLALPWLQVRRSIVVEMPPASPIASIPSEAIAVSSSASSIASVATDWWALAAWALAAGVAVRICRTGIGLWRLRQLRRTGVPAPEFDVLTELQQLVRARAEIRYVPSGQPVTFGFRRPVVLLPEMLRSQSPDIQRVVLCHELFHVRRRDWIWVVAEEIVKAVLWFHPAVLWLVARVRQAREEVVDELTVLATSQRRTYIEALLLFADAPTRSPAAAFTRRAHLFRRMLLISKEAVMSSKRILTSVAAMTAIIAAGVWSAASVFPLTQTVIAQGRAGAVSPPLAGVAAQSQAGPLELQAKPVTPENPIPRRTFSVSPQTPSDGGSGVVAVTVRLVVDRQGRVGEARSIGGARGGRAATAQPVAPPSEAFAKAVIDAVRQWQYEAPANGPIAFDVTFAFTPGSEARLLSHGASAFVAGTSTVMPPPAPPPPPPPGWAEGALRVGGNVLMPRKTKHVAPGYPSLAESAGVQGVVILELIIGPDGHVADSRVLRSIPLLDQAAIDAVRQWEFTPTRLNGSPVPVIMTATVQFTLGN